MIEHLNNFKGLINQLTKIEMKLDDELQVLLLLSSLPESWDTLVVTLSNSAPEGKLIMDTVADSLLNEEAKRKERGFSEANFVDNRGRNENRGRNKGHDKSRGRSKSHPKFVCYYCGKLDHKKSDCRYYKRDQKARKVIQDQIEHKREDKKTTTAVKDDNDVFLIGEENYLNLVDDDYT